MDGHDTTFGPPPGGRSGVSAAAPLTFGQEQLLVTEEVAEPGSLVLPLRIPLADTVPDLAVAAALRDVVARHDALRMSTHSGVAGPAQTAAARRAVEQLPPDADPVSYGAAAASSSTGKRPLFFSVREEPAGRRATVYLHHMFVDGWAAWLLAGEVTSRLTGARPAPGVPAESFAAYARALRQRMTAAAIARHVGHWQAELAGAQPLILPGTRVAWRPGARLGWMPALVVEVADCSLAQFTAAMRGLRASPTEGVLAAFATTLADASGQRDLLLETALSDRGALGTRLLVGCLTDRCVLRLRLAGGDPTAALPAAARSLRGALRHHVGPFQTEARGTEAGRILNLSPRVSIALNQELGARTPGAVDLRPRTEPDRVIGPCRFWTSSASSRSDLHAEMLGGPAAAPLRFRLVYRPDLWDAPAVEELGQAMAGRLRRLAGLVPASTLGGIGP